MAKYIYNHTSSIQLYKAGFLELHPQKVKAVSDRDFDSGIFEDGVIRGDLSVFDTEEEALAIKVPATQKITMEQMADVGSNGASLEDMLTHIQNQKAKAEKEAIKYQVQTPGAQTSEVQSTDPETHTPPVKTESTSADRDPGLEKIKAIRKAKTAELS